MGLRLRPSEDESFVARCAYCHEEASPGAFPLRSCPECRSLLHQECWLEIGCASLGCSRRRPRSLPVDLGALAAPTAAGFEPLALGLANTMARGLWNTLEVRAAGFEPLALGTMARGLWNTLEVRREVRRDPEPPHRPVRGGPWGAQDLGRGDERGGGGGAEERHRAEQF